MYDWPPKFPRPTLHKGKCLINHLEKEDFDKIKKERALTIPDFRTGDVCKLTMMSSQSEKKEVEYQGLVIGKSAPNSMRARCKLNFTLDQTNVVYNVQVYSPMIANFEIVKYGSNKNRKKLNHFPKLDLSYGRLQEPVIKGTGYKHRNAAKKYHKSERKQTGDKGKIYREQVTMDEQTWD